MSIFDTTQILNTGDYQIFLPRGLYRNPVKDWSEISFAYADDSQYDAGILILNFQVVAIKTALLVDMDGLGVAEYDWRMAEVTTAFKQLAERTMLCQKNLSPLVKGLDWVAAEYFDAPSIAGTCDDIYSWYIFGEV